MPRSALTLKFHRTFAALAAAARAAAATESRRAPHPTDLQTLGIDPALYRRINL